MNDKAADSTSASVRILVCDDDPHVRLGTARTLRKAGYEVLEAEDGTRCLAVARSERPELVLLDWVMPGMEGPEVCRQLKADPALAGLVVVMVSGARTSDDDRAAGFETGADAYLTHPLHPRAFLANIAVLVRMRQAEQRLRASQRLAALGTLASGVGHEINNPLMGIINYAQLVKDRCGESDPAIREYADEIIEGGDRIMKIVRGLTGLFAEQISTRPASLHPGALVDDVLLLTESAIRADGINLEVSMAEGLPLVRSHGPEFKQILFSLLKNARESLIGEGESVADGATIRISAEKIDLPNLSGDAQGTVEGVRISVEDNGPGIKAEHRNHIFEPFFTTKGRANHTGLELNVARTIAYRHGGALSVANGSGEWTRFRVDLPVATEHQEGE